VSGNVSLYNETNGAAIPPTPTVGAVGLIPNYARRASFGGTKAGDTLVLIGETHGEMGASLYLRELFGREEGAPPPVDLTLERKTGDFIRSLIMAGEAKVVHDLSDGGLAAAAAEMAMAARIGVTLNASSHPHAHYYLFGEDQARYLLATSDPAALIGEAFASEGLFSLPLSDLTKANEAWLPGFMGEAVE
jgi:phosphoribosylformylglycinamidine synthase